MCVIQVGVGTKFTYEVEGMFMTEKIGVFECKNVLSIYQSCL